MFKQYALKQTVINCKIMNLKIKVSRKLIKQILITGLSILTLIDTVERERKQVTYKKRTNSK